MNKQQLKHEHRSQMVRIGLRAIEHAMRLIPQDSKSCKTIQDYLVIACSNDLQRITELIRHHNQFLTDVASRVKQPRPYACETCLTEAAEALLRLAVAEKWVSGLMLETVFVPCWNGASCISNPEQAAEMDFQNKI
jgi:hypothetical protein